MTGDTGEYIEWRSLTLVTLTSIATVIGSGILALPVTMYETSFPLFVTFFTLALAAQIAAVFAVVELLQRARLAQAAAHAPNTGPVPPVSLYTLAALYLPSPGLRFAFHITTLFCLVTLLVSYGLAGPQAVWQLLSPSAGLSEPPSPIFAGYWLVGTVAVVFFLDVMLPVFGSFTVLKGVLFSGVIFIVAALPAAAHVTSVAVLLSHFSGISRAAAPFLMSCVALGGLSNTCPVTFALIPKNASAAQMRRYRIALVAALVVCYALNVGWVLVVLLVVPRTAATGKPSLALAFELGEISTVPLIAELNRGGAVAGALLRAVDIIIELFILVSTAVSYFVNAAALKSFIDGFAEDCKPLDRYIKAYGRRWLAYFFVFGSILGIIVANPEGFIAILTRFSSFNLSFQAGFMLFVMLFFCRMRATNANVPSQNELEAHLLSDIHSHGKSDIEDEMEISPAVGSSHRDGEGENHKVPSVTQTKPSLVWPRVGREAGKIDRTGAELTGRERTESDRVGTLPLADSVPKSYDSVDSPPTSDSTPSTTEAQHDEMHEVEAGYLFPQETVKPVLKLARWHVSGLITFGSPFFGLACLLAAFGPLFGIKLGSHE